MLIYDDMTAVVASRAYELAQTGQFEDLAAIERELVAEGFGDEIGNVKKPALQSAINAVCIANGQTLTGEYRALRSGLPSHRIMTSGQITVLNPSGDGPATLLSAVAMTDEVAG
jgi:hypothetical protein